jgi:hypothetical protein
MGNASIFTKVHNAMRDCSGEIGAISIALKSIKAKRKKYRKTHLREDTDRKKRRKKMSSTS